jgi:hypothetical protein
MRSEPLKHFKSARRLVLLEVYTYGQFHFLLDHCYSYATKLKMTGTIMTMEHKVQGRYKNV